MNIVVGQQRIIFLDLLTAPTLGKPFQDELDRQPGSFDNGFPGQDRRVDDDSISPGHQSSSVSRTETTIYCQRLRWQDFTCPSSPDIQVGIKSAKKLGVILGGIIGNHAHLGECRPQRFQPDLPLVIRRRDRPPPVIHLDPEPRYNALLVRQVDFLPDSISVGELRNVSTSPSYRTASSVDILNSAQVIRAVAPGNGLPNRLKRDDPSPASTPLPERALSRCSRPISREKPP